VLAERRELVFERAPECRARFTTLHIFGKVGRVGEEPATVRQPERPRGEARHLVHRALEGQGLPLPNILAQDPGESAKPAWMRVSDPRLAHIIQRCQDLPGHELFQYLDANKKRQSVSSDDVNEYLRELTDRDMTAKDFRTWGGTMLAAVELRTRGRAASRREADRNVIEAIDKVSERLGNTRAVCRKYYVHPALIKAYLMGETVPQPPAMRKTRRKRGAALRRDEVLVLQFLQNRL